MDRTVDPEWYRKVFTIDTLDMPWAEGIVGETETIAGMLELRGDETILDLACGFGHHAMELARRGHPVVGVDLSREYVDYAVAEAARRGLRNVRFLCADLRDVQLDRAFDVVLSLFDGAIGYFEDDDENLKTFSVISAHLLAGGRHLMQLPNPEYARRKFPFRTWSNGSKMLELLEYDWDESRRLIYASTQPVPYGKVFEGLAPLRTRQRAYAVTELESILGAVGMQLESVTSLMDKGTPASDECEYVSVFSRKR